MTTSAGARSAISSPAHGVLVVPLEPLHVRARGDQRRVPLEQLLVVQQREPARDRGVATAVVERHDKPLHELCEAIAVTGDVRVLDRALGVAALLAPRGRPRRDRLGEPRLAAAQLGLERLAEQVLEPIGPRPGLGDGDQEQVRLRELFELGGGPGPVQRRVAERSAQAVEHRSTDEKFLVLLREVVEVLEVDVVADEAVRAPEGGDRLVVRPRELDERGEIDAGGPAFRALRHLRDLLVRHGQARAAEQQADLLLGEADLVDPEADDPGRRAQVGQRERKLGAAGQDDARGRRQVADDLPDDLKTLLVGEQVQVVDEQRERARRLERALEAGKHGRERAPRPGQHLDEPPVADADAVEREREVGQQRDRVVVALVHAEPRDRLSVDVREELGEQRGLAVAGGRDHERDVRRRLGTESSDELGARDRAVPQAGRRELGLQQRERSRQRLEDTRGRELHGRPHHAELTRPSGSTAASIRPRSYARATASLRLEAPSFR